jgi:hypothetical protein
MATEMLERKNTTVHHWPKGGVGNGMSEQQATAAMRAFLHAMGRDATDFELQMDDGPLSGYVPTDDRLLTVVRRSTGLERLYSAGPHSAWLAELISDVEGGEFGAMVGVRLLMAGGR